MCAYNVTDLGDVFNEGKFKTPVAVETSHIKWVMYTGEMPVPRPGAVSGERGGKSIHGGTSGMAGKLKRKKPSALDRARPVLFFFQCINNAARKMGMNRSLDLPDKTLQFIRDRPLMDEAARPLGGGPLLVKRGTLLTRIVVDSVPALDGRSHAVMFIGTG